MDNIENENKIIKYNISGRNSKREENVDSENNINSEEKKKYRNDSDNNLNENLHHNTPKLDSINNPEIDSKNKNGDNNFIEEDNEDEYFRQCQNRRQKNDDKRNSDYIKNINNTISHSKFGNLLRGSLNIKIYILNTCCGVNFEVSYTDTIKDLKMKIYKQIENDPRFKLNYKSLGGK
jgi:hypothetical protein